MNNDLISRSNLIDTFSNTVFFDEDSKCKALEIIDNAPAINTYTIEDIQEVLENALIVGAKLAQGQQGEWKVKTKSTFPQYQPDEYICPFCNTIVNYKTNYCPNCGAKLKKGGAE